MLLLFTFTHTISFHSSFFYRFHSIAFVFICSLFLYGSCKSIIALSVLLMYVMFFCSLFLFFLVLFLYLYWYVSSNSYTVMGGQHRWAPAFLAACHYIYFTIYTCIFLIWLIKLLLLLLLF